MVTCVATARGVAVTPLAGISAASSAATLCGVSSSPFGALSAVNRGTGAVNPVGASVGLPPMASGTPTRGVALFTLAADHLTGGSAAPSVAATPKASSAASGATAAATIPATAPARAASPTPSSGGAYVTAPTTTSAAVAAVALAVAVAASGESAAFWSIWFCCRVGQNTWVAQ